MKKKILYIFILILILIQFVRIDKTNISSIKTNDFIIYNNSDSNISNILQKSCYDCHSNNIKYPWYSNIAPISWWIKHHVNEGQQELNFSEWATYSTKRKKKKLYECILELKEDNMPLKSYLIMHKVAKLTQEDKIILTNYFKNLIPIN